MLIVHLTIGTGIFSKESEPFMSASVTVQFGFSNPYFGGFSCLVFAF